MEDLVTFVSRDDLPPVAQAAIAHAQFETIHPFVDGNGRVGRCLIQMVLRRRGVAAHVVPPVSIVLAARADSYTAGLVGFREGRIAEWIASFSAAARLAASASVELAGQVTDLQARWFERAGQPRAGSAAAKIIRLLPALPVLSAPTARVAIDTSQQKTLVALGSRERRGVFTRDHGRVIG